MRGCIMLLALRKNFHRWENVGLPAWEKVPVGVEGLVGGEKMSSSGLSSNPRCPYAVPIFLQSLSGGCWVIKLGPRRGHGTFRGVPNSSARQPNTYRWRFGTVHRGRMAAPGMPRMYNAVDSEQDKAGHTP